MSGVMLILPLASPLDRSIGFDSFGLFSVPAPPARSNASRRGFFIGIWSTNRRKLAHGLHVRRFRLMLSPPLLSSRSRPPMPPIEPEVSGVEPDGRFPSGPWTGYFLQPPLPGKQWMELLLTFREGAVRGEGRDWVGDFLVDGRYQVDDGKCWWTKAYVKKHSIAYEG